MSGVMGVFWSFMDALAFSEPPLLRRGLMAAFGFICGYGSVIVAAEYLNEKRRLLRAALVGAGFAIYASTLLLFVVTPLRFTWGWPV